MGKSSNGYSTHILPYIMIEYSFGKLSAEIFNVVLEHSYFIQKLGTLIYRQNQYND
jgi:hypothetical protein